jgi:hypothetical protein
MFSELTFDLKLEFTKSNFSISGMLKCKMQRDYCNLSSEEFEISGEFDQESYFYNNIEADLHIMLYRKLWYLAVASQSAPVNETTSDEIDIEQLPHAGPVRVFYLILAQLNYFSKYSIL